MDRIDLVLSVFSQEISWKNIGVYIIGRSASVTSKYYERLYVARWNLLTTKSAWSIQKLNKCAQLCPIYFHLHERFINAFFHPHQCQTDIPRSNLLFHLVIILVAPHNKEVHANNAFAMQVNVKLLLQTTFR